MLKKIKTSLDLASNMGARYVFFRISHLFKTKLGWYKIVFPINPKFKNYISLNEWRGKLSPFFFYGKNIFGLRKNPENFLKSNFNEIRNGIYTFFNKSKIDLGKNYDWITNPINNHKYDINKHWSEINDFSTSSGDIKYVWEKARFSFLYDIIRYDYHFQIDQSEFVFSQIEDFIDKNPINQGPNYKCSQEISLRVLNWTFALYYFKDSKNLTNDLFNKIMHSIYWQIHHVYKNINFSRISVRNNHAITETLLLYLSNKLFPFFPNVNKWSYYGKSWFEQEIEYQIYPDGTFLQFSMNYHRVVIQLLTWGIQLSRLYNDSFNKVVYERAEKSLHFLDTCSDNITGKLPNYGSNDGALFFKLVSNDYRIYRSQLDDLRAVIRGYTYFSSTSKSWYGLIVGRKEQKKIKPLNQFKHGGYYIIQDGDTKTFIRCGGYKDRPFQSDNLHLDIWVDGENILRDNGSYKYNTEKKYLEYFNGCEGHNTISIAGNNQMQKGKRFIWNYWVKDAKANLSELNNQYVFDGKIECFKQLGSGIYHQRKVLKTKGIDEWVIEDIVTGIENKNSFQYWHFSNKIIDKLSIICVDQYNKKLTPVIENKWHSSYYGIKESSIRLSFESSSNFFRTKINYKK